MSVNLSAAIDEKKVRHLGKHYSTIDFELKENVNPTDFKYAKMKPVIGKLEISGRSYDVTYSELNHIVQTCVAAMGSADMAYKIGKWGRAQAR